MKKPWFVYSHAAVDGEAGADGGGGGEEGIDAGNDSGNDGGDGGTAVKPDWPDDWRSKISASPGWRSSGPRRSSATGNLTASPA